MSSSCWEYVHGLLFELGGLFRGHTIKEIRLFLVQKPPAVNICLGMGCLRYCADYFLSIWFRLE